MTAWLETIAAAATNCIAFDCCEEMNAQHREFPAQCFTKSGGYEDSTVF